MDSNKKGNDRLSTRKMINPGILQEYWYCYGDRIFKNSG